MLLRRIFGPTLYCFLFQIHIKINTLLKQKRADSTQRHTVHQLIIFYVAYVSNKLCFNSELPVVLLFRLGALHGSRLAVIIITITGAYYAFWTSNIQMLTLLSLLLLVRTHNTGLIKRIMIVNSLIVIFACITRVVYIACLLVWGLIVKYDFKLNSWLGDKLWFILLHNNVCT